MQDDQQNPELVPEPKEEHVIADYVEGMKQLELEAYQTSIRKARNTLFVAAALTFIGEMYSISQTPDGFTALTMTIILIEVGLFVALAFWSKKKPFTAIIAGIILIFLYWALSVYVDPANIFKGILVRIIMISYLVRATSDAKRWEALKKETE
jgi:hypothetical protein